LSYLHLTFDLYKATIGPHPWLWSPKTGVKVSDTRAPHEEAKAWLLFPKSIKGHNFVSKTLLSYGHGLILAFVMVNYCASHVLVQPNFRRCYFYFLPDQAQILLDHFNVLDEL